MVRVERDALDAGLLVTLSLSGSVSGTIRAYASRYPDVDPESPNDATHITELPVAGAFPSIKVSMLRSGYWFVWLSDDDGYTGPFGVSATMIEDEWLVATGKSLRDRVESFRPMLNAILRRRFPNHDGLFTVSYGFADNKIDAPFVVVTKPVVRPEPYILGGTFRYRIECGIVAVVSKAADETDETDLAANIGMALTRVLNLPRYNAMELPGGCQLTDCRVQEASASMQPAPVGRGYLWYATAVMRWSGELLNTGL